MKKQSFVAYLFVMFALLFSVAAYAQDDAAYEKKTPQEKAEIRTKKLTEKLQLTAEQVPQVKAALLTRIEKTETIRKQPKGDKKGDKMKQAKAAHDEFDSKMKTILTADQYKQYEVIREEMKEKIQEKREEKKKNG